MSGQDEENSMIPSILIESKKKVEEVYFDSSHSDALKITEEILEIRKKSNREYFDQIVSIIKIIHFFLTIETIKKFIFSIFILKALNENDNTFSLLFLSQSIILILEFFFKIGIFFLYNKNFPNFKNYLIIDILQSFFYSLIFYGFFLYTKGDIHVVFLPIFMAPSILINIFLIFKKKMRNLLYLNILNFIEFAQVLLIMVNLIFNFYWNIILFVFEIKAVVFYVFACVLIILMAIYIIYVILISKCGIDFEKVISFYVFTYSLFYIWYFMCYFYFLRGLRYILKKNCFMTANSKIKLDSFPELKYVSDLLFFFSLLVIGATSVYYVLLIAFLKLKSTKRESLASFVTNLKHLQYKMENKIKNFFKKDNEKIEENENKEERRSLLVQSEQNKCEICDEGLNQVIINPCGHSDFCKNCITKYLENNKNCPKCGKKIENVISIEHDKEKNIYNTTYLLK